MTLDFQMVTKAKKSHLTLLGEAGRGLPNMCFDFQAITKTVFEAGKENAVRAIRSGSMRHKKRGCTGSVSEQPRRGIIS